ncbi:MULTISPECIES: paeninodin family lasso peptide [Bacillus]|uniref:Paeninodin family lasso peptide n=1 Tax=Bacillus arachidis TaxID=2819290 RepID=A0ABS3NTR4_9BACI|nr:MULTISPECIES: paeninodin family lasso peptide [Bacillus]MBO1623971.1 paeninodin family lasso peptide [Bacillus arachidis]MED0992676.1 paeninodin family lasso peptide [Bacillus nitratireducens]MED1055431.1 paeninodin family lasso peptide [Bacillus mycoides]QUG86571.1 paeninodin family lasso peptide [Bacillus nitratireducens]WIY61141.1 paeninodin family lasso peptide [Bacillus arachidis]
MKQEWQSPVLEVLDINMTMAGPGKRIVDQVFEDEDEQGTLSHS